MITFKGPHRRTQIHWSIRRRTQMWVNNQVKIFYFVINFYWFFEQMITHYKNTNWGNDDDDPTAMIDGPRVRLHLWIGPWMMVATVMRLPLKSLFTITVNSFVWVRSVSPFVCVGQIHWITTVNCNPLLNDDDSENSPPTFFHTGW